MPNFPIDALKPNARNARTHSKKQIRQIADSIAAFGFVVPILIDEDGNIIAGYGRYAEYKTMQSCYLESLASPVPLCVKPAVISA